MSNFDKKAYDKQYQRDNIKPIKISVSIEEYNSFADMCENIGIQKTTFIKNAINEAAIKYGFAPIFSAKKKD